MKLRVYTVFDSKVEAFLTPFFMRADGEAVRAAVEAGYQDNHNFSKYAADYTLVCIGEWDDATAAFYPLDAKANLGNILQLMAQSRASVRENGNG